MSTAQRVLYLTNMNKTLQLNPEQRIVACLNTFIGIKKVFGRVHTQEKIAKKNKQTTADDKNNGQNEKEKQHRVKSLQVCAMKVKSYLMQCQKVGANAAQRRSQIGCFKIHLVLIIPTVVGMPMCTRY